MALDIYWIVVVLLGLLCAAVVIGGTVALILWVVRAGGPRDRTPPTTSQTQFPPD